MTYKSDNRLQNFTDGEHIANSVSHGIGIGLSIAGLVLLIVRAVKLGTAWHVVSFSIFGGTLIFLYLASTLYHSFPKRPIKAFLQRLDHIAIYFLIAGTYTPFLLTNLKSPMGWVVFGIVWTLALTGLVLKLSLTKRFNNPSVGLYLAMGWLIVLLLRQAIQSFDLTTLLMIAIGGVFYTSGILFYRARKLSYSHAIWHVFVLAGSIFHFFGVMAIL